MPLQTTVMATRPHARVGEWRRIVVFIHRCCVHRPDTEEGMAPGRFAQCFLQLRYRCSKLFIRFTGLLIWLGIDLVRSGRLDATIKVFMLNTQIYPHSANTWDSLGYTFLTQGNKPLACEN